MEKLVAIVDNKLYFKAHDLVDSENYQNFIDRVYAYEELLLKVKLIDARKRMTSICDGKAFLSSSSCMDGLYLKKLLSSVAKYEYLLEQNNLIKFKD